MFWLLYIIMEPINIKVIPSAQNFDIDQFNDQFEDMTLLSKIDTSEVIHHLSVNDEDIFIDTAIVDLKLAEKINWYDPTREDWVNPNQDSKKRIVFFTLIDKFSKRVLVMKYPNDKRGFYCLGGRPKIFESADHAAVRLFKQFAVAADVQQTRIVPILSADIPIRTIKVDPTVSNNIPIPTDDSEALIQGIVNYKPTSVLYNNKHVHSSYSNRDVLENTVENVTTYASFLYNGKILNPNCGWVSVHKFKNYDDYNFRTYYKHIFNKIMQHLY